MAGKLATASQFICLYVLQRPSFMIFSERNIEWNIECWYCAINLTFISHIFPMCCVVFNKTNVILPHLTSLSLQFEKFYMESSLCFYLISVKVSEFIYLEIHLRNQLNWTLKEYTA